MHKLTSYINLINKKISKSSYEEYIYTNYEFVHTPLNLFHFDDIILH